MYYLIQICKHLIIIIITSFLNKIISIQFSGKGIIIVFKLVYLHMHTFRTNEFF